MLLALRTDLNMRCINELLLFLLLLLSVNDHFERFMQVRESASLISKIDFIYIDQSHLR